MKMKYIAASGKSALNINSENILPPLFLLLKNQYFCKLKKS